MSSLLQSCCRLSGFEGSSNCYGKITWPPNHGALSLRRLSPRSRERLRVALKGFSPNELEPRTSDGELVADLLASAGAEFQRKKSGGGKLRGSSGGSSPASSVGSPSPLQVLTSGGPGHDASIQEQQKIWLL